MLSKRILASSFYESICPNCKYRTVFTASNLVQREFLNACSEKKDYSVISYDIKCQVCLNRFQPTSHKTANFYNNPTKEYLYSSLQKEYISAMKSFCARVPTGVGGIRLGQKTEELKSLPRHDNVSVFIVDEIAKGQDVLLYITGHNLNEQILACELQLDNIQPVPVTEAMDHHFNDVPQILGDVSHVFRS